MAVTWSITNTEYNNDSNKGVVHASWQCNDSEVVGSGDSAVTHIGTVSGMESFTPEPDADGYIAYDRSTSRSPHRHGRRNTHRRSLRTRCLRR